MMRFGKRSLGKILAVFITTLLVFIVGFSVVMSPKDEIKAAQKNTVQLRIHPVRTGTGDRRAGSRLARRKSPLGPNRFLSKNVSWVHKSRFGSSKHNISANLKKKDKNSSVPIRRNTGIKVLKTKADIKEVMLKLKEKRMLGGGQRSKVDYVPSRDGASSCVPRMNVAYIKTHKTASTTLQTVINRFGLLQKLSFVLSKISPNNGHFVYIPVTEFSPKFIFLPPLGISTGNFSQYRYNMVAVHLRYNRSAMDTFMLPGTKYISIIREPSAHFESAFNHFRFSDSFSAATKCRVKGREIEEFMRKPGYYRRKLKTLPWDTTRGLRWYYARNNQIFDLGLDSKYHEDEVVVNRTIDVLAKEMDLVLISEYFDESLILLKKMMCWSFDDIVYISKNQRTSRVSIGDGTRSKIRQWSRADTFLYERFNATLWQKIRDYGSNFQQDLAIFRDRKEEVFLRCVGNKTIKSHGIFKHREFVPTVNSSLFCNLVAESKTKLFHRVWRRQGGEWAARMKAAARKRKPGLKKNDSMLIADGGTQSRKREMEDGVIAARKNEPDVDVGDEDEIGDDRATLNGQIGGALQDKCGNVLQDEDIDFRSSAGNNLVFPEET